MKYKLPRRMLSAILALALVVGFLPVTRVSAQNITGLMYASTVIADQGVVLMGDTHLYMDIDLSVPYIEGDYNLTIDGSGKLTVNGSGNGIDVKSLYCESDLFVQPGWHAIEVSETVYINNAECFVVGGIYAEGDINIQSNNATIGGNGNAIFSNGGNITLSGSTFDIGANGVAVYAETGGIYMTGNFTVNSNNDRTIDTAKGEVVIEGSLKSTSGAQFDPEVHFVNRDFFSIGAAKGFNFYGTTLEVTGLGGIDAGANASDADISITADSVSIITERYYAMYGSYIYVDSDELWLENEGSEENENVTYNFDTVFGSKDVTLHSESGGIVGEYGIYAGENLTLNGTFVVGADTDADIAALYTNGRMEVNGSLTVRADHTNAITANEGFSFNGTTLDIEGFGGIDADGDVYITADNVSVLTQKQSCIDGNTVNIDCDVLRLENVPNVNDPEVGQYGIACYESATVNCPDATIIACDHGVYGNGCDVTLNGNFTILGKGDFGKGIWASNLYLNGGQFTVASNILQAIDAGHVEVRGNLSLSTEGEYHCLTAQEFMFDGTTLTADGHAGINSNYTDITADSVMITTDVGTTISGYEVYVKANYLWAENKATKIDSDWLGQGKSQFGISAVSKLALTVKGGTVIGYDAALFVYDRDSEFEHHYIYVDGALTAVSRTGSGMYVPQGTAEGYGGPIVSVGETHGIHAKYVYFDGYSLRVDGNTGIYALDSVDLAGQDIKITAFDERRSGIWCENGNVDLEGKVVINTSGWYGINAGGDLTLGEGYFAISGPEGDAQAVKTAGTLTLDGTLEIIQPDGGHVNGNEIYGAGDSPALDVLIYSAIPDVSLLIDGPREGELPTRTAAGIYFLDPRCTVEEIVWYEDGEELVSQDALFRAGHSYTVRIFISADDPYYFSEDIWGKVNGENVSTGLTDRKIIRLTADLGECPNSVGFVDLKIAAPVEGNTPSKGVTAGNTTYGVYSRDVRWAVSTDGVNFVSMAEGEKFAGGKYYRVFMDVNLAGNQYKFPVTTATGSVQPDVISYVNGNLAVTKKAYDQDPEEVITVYFDFGKCNDFIIEEIDIVDVVAPVAGQHPTYTANMFGTGYHVDTTKNSYYDAYWVGEKWYYVKNGIAWWDVTDGGYEYVYENDVFQAGHQYQCEVYVRTDDGYEFVLDMYTEPATYPTATMNGNPANVIQYGSSLMWEQKASCTFTCSTQEITSVRVNGLDTPQAGKNPDHDAAVAVPGSYQLDTTFGTNGIQWYNCEQLELYAEDTFVVGESYCIAIRLITAGEGFRFTDDLEFYINDKVVTPYGYWDNVVVDGNTVTAYYTFRNAASAPEIESYQFTISPSGTALKVGQTINGFWQTNFLPEMTEIQYWDGESWDQWDVQYSENTLDSYDFVSVDAGTYQFRIAAYMGSEIVATSEEFTITWIAAGDADGSGAVDSYDATLISQYAAGWDVTIDLTTADVDGSGVVDSYDATLISQYAAGWDVTLS